MRSKKAISILVSTALMLTCLCAGIVGCSGQSEQTDAQDNAAVEPSEVRIGTMPTEDILPMWVAENENLFGEAGISAQIVTFDSAQALSAAITAGEVDMAMVDIMRAVKLCESGAPVVLEWVTLGTEASQGRFGILAPADAPYSTLQELAEQAQQNPDSLAGEGVGVAANTVPEYVFDMLCEQAGIPEGSIPTQEVASLPERYSLMASGQLAGAALPGSLLELGEANGMKLLADDATGTDGENISQSVMIATEAFAQDNPDLVEKVAEVWDIAVEEINSNPSAYISLLAEKANLNETIADSYPISTYPLALRIVAVGETAAISENSSSSNADASVSDAGSADDSAATSEPSNGQAEQPDPIEQVELAHPAADYVNKQIEWMRAKGYSSHSITYNEATGELLIGA